MTETVDFNDDPETTLSKTKATEESLNYRGRSTLRSDGSRKRKEILNAALRIIAREGIRGVRHRAVAKEADVSLSSTTYYFKDIHELIADAFTLYAENSLQENQPLEQAATSLLASLGQPLNKVSSETKQLVVSKLTSFLVDHIKRQSSQTEARLIEWAFRQAATQDASLAPAVLAMQNEVASSAEKILELLGSNNPKADALITVTAIQALEYKICISPEDVSDEDIHKTMEHLMARVLMAI
ncbi:MAG: TetR family transcriptional regulator [Cellvibrionaceae bacterium]